MIILVVFLFVLHVYDFANRHNYRMIRVPKITYGAMGTARQGNVALTGLKANEQKLNHTKLRKRSQYTIRCA